MRRLILLLAVFLFTSVAAHAQAPAAPAAPAPASLVDELTSAPIIGQAGVSITPGGTFQSGRTEARDFNIDGIVARTTSRRTLLRLDVETSVSHHRPADADHFVEIEDNNLVSMLVMQPWRPRLSAVGVGGWRRDGVLQLAHRIAAGGGLGIHVIERPRSNLTLIPLFVVGDEHRMHTTVGEGVADVGVLETVAVRLHDRLIVEQSMQANLDTTELDDHTLRFDASINSEVVRHINLNVYLQLQHDALVPAGQDKLQVKTGVGVQVSFARTR